MVNLFIDIHDLSYYYQTMQKSLNELQQAYVNTVAGSFVGPKEALDFIEGLENFLMVNEQQNQSDDKS